MKYVIVGLGGAAIVVLTVLIGAFIRGFVLAKLWLWFVVPFFGAPILALWQAYGLALTASVLVPFHTPHCEDKREPEEQIVTAAARIVSPFVALFLGWVVKAYFLGN